MALIVVPTPVGNLGDMTQRAIDVLQSADVILCEDTRHSGILCTRWNISAPRLSYQKFNEKARQQEILDRLAKGQIVALVSDAGTPGISDPGALIIAAAIDAGFDVDVLPGATAFVPALLLSGLTPHPFLFAGFLPDGTGDRRKEIERWKSLEATLIFYLSPHKALRHVKDLLELLGDRKAALIREISKVHQESRRGTLSQLASSLEEGVKGELVLVVERCLEEPEPQDWRPHAMELLRSGLSVRDVTDRITGELKVSRNDVKRWLMAQSLPEDL